MTTLADKIRAAIDETERIAQAALSHPTKYDPATQEELPNGTDDGVWKTDGCDVESANVPWGGGIRIYDEGGHDEEQAEHIALHDPAAVLRRCAADRKILDLHAILWRDISWLVDGDEECAEIPVCELCVPKHSGFPSRAEVPEGACGTVLALAEAYGEA